MNRMMMWLLDWLLLGVEWLRIWTWGVVRVSWLLRNRSLLTWMRNVRLYTWLVWRAYVRWVRRGMGDYVQYERDVENAYGDVRWRTRRRTR